MQKEISADEQTKPNESEQELQGKKTRDVRQAKRLEKRTIRYAQTEEGKRNEKGRPLRSQKGKEK